jgi:hypothetical protein
MSFRAAFIFIVMVVCVMQDGRTQTKLIPFNSSRIYYEGRIPQNASAAGLAWPGTSATLIFKGRTISALLEDRDTANYYNVIVDGKVVNKIRTDPRKRTYLLASDLPPGKHQVELFKRTEAAMGKTLFYGFETDSDAKIYPKARSKKRKIEFYGNSITCGYADEDSIGDAGLGYVENGYLSYAAITARHFNAAFSSISKSGIGIMLSWFPIIMPEMYDRLDPADSTSKWDFTQYTPDVVVINLFQNDSWLIKMHDHEEFKHRFGTIEPSDAFIVACYKTFLSTIRSKYPHASIICALGSMDATREGSPWPRYITKAVNALHDPNIYTHFFPYKDTGGHPDVREQNIMAESLIDFIEKNIKW